MALVTGLLLVCWVAASAQDIRFNYVQGTNFSQYKTYKWVRIPKAQYPNSIMDEQIMQAIEAQLALKGLSKTEDNPDLYITTRLRLIRRNSGTLTASGGDYWGWGGWGGWGGMSTTTTTSSTINIGTINCDIYDVAKKKQIWRGEASKTLGSGKDPERFRKT